MKGLILIGLFVVLAIFVYAEEYQISQAQLDALNTTTMTWQNLLCESNGAVYLERGNIHTNYSCMSFYQNEDQVSYTFYRKNYRTQVSLNSAVNCINEFNLTYCEDWYWDRVIQQALERVDFTLIKIAGYQGYTPNGAWGDWSNDIFN